MNVEQFYGTGSSLLDRLDQRLTPTTRELTREFLEVGEWALFVDELAAELTQDHTLIDVVERDLLHELLYTFEREESDATHYKMIWNRDQVMAALNVVSAPRRQAG